MVKEFRHYRILEEQLKKHVDDVITKDILKNMDYVKDSSKPEIKARWAYEVTKRLDDCGCTVVREGLDRAISKTWCQCCKGSLLSVYKYVFNEKECEMDIFERSLHPCFEFKIIYRRGKL